MERSTFIKRNGVISRVRNLDVVRDSTGDGAKTVAPRAAGPAARTSPQLVWAGLRRVLRKNILAVMDEYVSKMGQYSEDILNRAGAYNRGFFSNGNVADFKDDKKMRQSPILYGDSVQNTHLRVAFLWATEPKTMIDRYLDTVICYSTKGNATVKLSHVLYQDSNVNTIVMRGTYTDDNETREVAVKYITNNRLVEKEISLYERLASIDSEIVPWFQSNMMLWGEPVLVTELLTPLDAGDDIRDIGMDVIDCFKKIHFLIVHSDIKPSNIMKRKNKRGQWAYILIDYGGSTDKKEGEMYVRRAYSKYFANIENPEELGQPGKKCFTSPKNELLELLYTLNAIRLGAVGTNRPTKAYKMCKDNFEDVLAECYDHWLTIPTTPSMDDYGIMSAILDKD